MAIVIINDSSISGGDIAPNAPSALVTEKEWDGVRLHWDNPSNKDIAYIEVWRNTSNDRSTAIKVAEVMANDYMDHSLETGIRYYWIRATNTTGLNSTWYPVSSTNGISGSPEQVEVTSAADKHLLQYNSSNNTWVNTQLRDGTRVKGAIEATQNESYSVAPPALNTTSGNNGFDIVSSTGGTNGFGAQCSITQYFADTAAGTNTSASIQMRSANGVDITPTTTASADTLGTLNYSGYSGSGFANYIASQNQGGGMSAYHPLQIQAVASEASVETAFTLANAVQTSTYIARQTLTIGSVSSSGNGVFTNTSGDIRRNDLIRITGTLTGTMTFPGYVSGNLYYVTVGANPTTTFTLSTTPGGKGVATTSGTTTGLTFERHRVQFNYATQTVIPFSANAKLTIAGSTSGKFDGTGYAVFSTATGTAIGMYIATTGNQTSAAGTIGLTNVTGAASLRVRGFVPGQPMNGINRISLIDHGATSATYRADTITLQQGSGTTNHLVLDTTKATFTKPVVYPLMDTTTRNALTPGQGWVIFNTTTAKLECYDGTAWQALF